jgi:predicted AAA+ superfamily ATPase
MQTFVKRLIAKKLTKHIENFPCVVLLGARQVGKSTLAKAYVEENTH